VQVSPAFKEQKKLLSAVIVLYRPNSALLCAFAGAVIR
jgi:hypothetical protein